MTANTQITVRAAEGEKIQRKFVNYVTDLQDVTQVTRSPEPLLVETHVVTMEPTADSADINEYRLLRVVSYLEACGYELVSVLHTYL